MWIAAPLAVLALAGGTIAVAARTQTAPVLLDSNHITICHATGNGEWVQISPDDNSIIGENGHAGHPQDIIPPFTYTNQGVAGEFPGLNWDAEGQGIWNAGPDKPACALPPPPPPPPAFPIGVFVKCIDRSGSTFSATFGYESGNSIPVSLPVGSANAVEPGGPGRGQPETFQPGNVAAAFTVSGVPVGETVRWSVTYGGATHAADATADFGTLCTPPPEPPKIEVTLSVCVVAGATTFEARFAYHNKGEVEATVPHGTANRFEPESFGAGRPIVFLPGENADALTIGGIPNGTTVEWFLTTGVGTRSARASVDSPACSGAPPPGPEPTQKPIRVAPMCVVRGDTTYEARFSYESDNDAAVTIPIGPDNRFSPPPEGRGQPTVFSPDGGAIAVAGIPNGTSLIWLVTLGGTTEQAQISADFPTLCTGPTPPTPPGPTDPPLPPRPPDPVGEPIGVFVDCVEDHGATYDAVFGYQNQNEDAVRIPAGGANGFRPAPVDRGQVTEFLPGNVQRAFTVEGIARGTEPTWAVTYAGETRTATVSALFETACTDDPDAPDPIGIFACIQDRGSTFDVTFGYENDNPVAVSLPIGVRNHVDPGGPNRGQPIIFVPGREASAFTVRGVPSDGFVAWTISYRGLRSAIVTAEHPVACGGAEPDLVLRPFAFCSRRTGDTFTAVFGYVNTNREDVLVPVGARNRVGPGSADQGQPTTFRGGNAYASFAVRNIPVGRTVTWSVASFGVTQTASVDVETRACVRRPVDDEVDVAITKAASPRTVVAGQRVDYTLVVRNVGPTTAYAVTVEDVQLDQRVRLLSAATAKGRCGLQERPGPRQVVTCFLGDLGPGETVTIAIGGRGAIEGTSRNRALVLSLPLDSGANNSAVASVRVRPASGVLGGGVRPPFTG